jgi:flagellar biosynthesis chaperone FliJ
MKNDVEQKQKIGLLAQEVQKVFPELVSEDNNGMLAVNYQALVPVLINALKEQENNYNELEKSLEILEKEILKNK